MAVNSMAGHIIGLGDRHLQNVLLDTRTADAVHIDLGIAFEQAGAARFGAQRAGLWPTPEQGHAASLRQLMRTGAAATRQVQPWDQAGAACAMAPCAPAHPQGRFLNTPELVPFRLTRDVVDGMGVAGVEGVMRRCCEETLRVGRAGGSPGGCSGQGACGARRPHRSCMCLGPPAAAVPATTGLPRLVALSRLLAPAPLVPARPPQVLRASKESVLTVVEVFIHDPLYKWALTTTAANRRQHEADVAGGGGAEVGSLRGGTARCVGIIAALGRQGWALWRCLGCSALY